MKHQNKKTVQVDQILRGGDTDTTRRQLLKSSIGALGTLYLAPATLSLLTAERATAQSGRDTTPPTIDVNFDSADNNIGDTLFGNYTCSDDTGITAQNNHLTGGMFVSPELDCVNNTSGTFVVAKNQNVTSLTTQVWDSAGNTASDTATNN